METSNILDTLRSRISRFERGRIFFIEDVSEVDDPAVVRHYLPLLVEEGYILKLARGIYCFPKMRGEYVPIPMIPDAETIAETLARRENVKIIPYGDVAARRLGLIGMSVSSLRYLTDGSPRVINLSSKEKIYFNHTSEVKMFAFRNETVQMLCNAIRALGKEFFNDEGKRRKVREILAGIPENEFVADLLIAPAWVQDLVFGIRGDL